MKKHFTPIQKGKDRSIGSSFDGNDTRKHYPVKISRRKRQPVRWLKEAIKRMKSKHTKKGKAERYAKTLEFKYGTYPRTMLLEDFDIAFTHSPNKTRIIDAGKISKEPGVKIKLSESPRAHFVGMVEGILRYQSLLEGRLIKQRPERLAELKRELSDHKPKKRTLRFDREVEWLKRILTKENPLRFHSDLPPEILETIAESIVTEFEAMRPIVPEAEITPEPEKQDTVAANWFHRFVKTNSLTRIGEIEKEIRKRKH